MADIAPISASEGRAKIDRGAILVDVRSDAGRESSGTLHGATLVDKAAVEEFAAVTPKDEEIVIFCGTIAGSGPVATLLAESGFTNVSHVDGGFAALAAEGVPSTRPARVSE